MADKNYSIGFVNDPNAPRTLTGTVQLDNIEYEVTITPKQKIVKLDRRELMEKQSVSQGPGSGACPYCGRG